MTPAARSTPPSAIAAWRSRTEELSIGIARAEAVRLAKRVRVADQELSNVTKQLMALLSDSPAAGLLDKPGIGPVTAAIAYAAWSQAGRVRSEAAFASLAGVNPIPASSGNTIRHRINRGGDRRLNRALHMAVVTRMRTSTSAPPKDAPSARSAALSSATSPARSTDTSTPPNQPLQALDKHRRFTGYLQPDGQAFVVNGREGVVLWTLDPGRHFEAACTMAGRELTQTEWSAYLSDLGPKVDTCECCRRRGAP